MRWSTYLQKSGETGFITALEEQVKFDALMTAELTLSSEETMVCVYASCEAGVDAAITLAWTAAREQTAQALEDATAFFKAAHGKPKISRKNWSPAA